MIARHETHSDKIDVWPALSAALPPGVIFWRQDGRTVNRDGRRLGGRRVTLPNAGRIRAGGDAWSDRIGRAERRDVRRKNVGQPAHQAEPESS
ncbi:MAG: hypothetical protein ABI601_04155 [bacterium]